MCPQRGCGKRPFGAVCLFFVLVAVCCLTANNCERFSPSVRSRTWGWLVADHPAPDTQRLPASEALLVPEPEARRLLGGISRRKLALMVAAGEIPSAKIGTRRLFPIEGLKAYVASQTEGGQ